jgi:hypothetical protein
MQRSERPSTEGPSLTDGERERLKTLISEVRAALSQGSSAVEGVLQQWALRCGVTEAAQDPVGGAWCGEGDV